VTTFETEWKVALFEDDFEMRRHADATLRLQRVSTLLIGEGNNGSLYEHVLDAAIDLMTADMGSMFSRNGVNSGCLLTEDLIVNQRRIGNGFVPIPRRRVEWHYPPGVGS
jgi:hypothetical protein